MLPYPALWARQSARELHFDASVFVGVNLFPRWADDHCDLRAHASGLGGEPLRAVGKACRLGEALEAPFCAALDDLAHAVGVALQVVGDAHDEAN